MVEVPASWFGHQHTHEVTLIRVHLAFKHENLVLSNELIKVESPR